MTLSDKAGTAWSNLGRRKVRTVLTSIGVVVGIMTIVTLVSLVNGVQRQVKEQFEKLGLDRVIARPPSVGGEDFGFFGFSERTKNITPSDVARWKRWPEVQEITPEVDLPFGTVTKLRLNGKLQAVRVEGQSSLRRRPFGEPPSVVAGTLSLPARSGVVLSQGALKRLGIKNFAQLLNRQAEIVLQAPRGESKSYKLKIVGVSSERESSASVATSDRLQMKSWWTNTPNTLTKDGYDSVMMRASDVSNARKIVQRLRAEKFQVLSIDALLDAANRIFTVVASMLALVSSVALLVACIGIVNTMIMAIYERTREIGTLKAMGASKGDIRAIFMMEAGLIGLLGGVAGLIASWLLGRGLNTLAIFLAKQRGVPLPDQLFLITPALALQAVAFAVLIGVLAGLYPANRAASLDPLTALRHE